MTIEIDRVVFIPLRKGRNAAVVAERYVVDGDRTYPIDPITLADGDGIADALGEFADLFNLSSVTDRDALAAEIILITNDRDTAISQLEPLNNQIATLQARIAELTAVPDVAIVTPRQAKLALYGAGLLDSVEAAIAVADRVVQISWVEAIEFRRDDPVLNGLASHLGLTGEQLDGLFAQAAKL